MKEAKKLSLKRERLTELSSDQLQGIAGGLDIATRTGDGAVAVRTFTCPTLTCGCSQGCWSDANCVSLDTCTCGCTIRVC